MMIWVDCIKEKHHAENVDRRMLTDISLEPAFIYGLVLSYSHQYCVT